MGEVIRFAPANASLTADDVREIREIAESRERLRSDITETFGGAALARRYHVSTSTIDRIICGNYRHGRAAVIASKVLADVAKRERLREFVNDHLSNEALAKRFRVHVNTIINVTVYANFRHVR